MSDTSSNVYGLSLDELSRRLQEAQKQGDMRKLLLVADAIMQQLVTPAAEQDNLDALDTKHLAIVTSVAVRALIRLELEDSSAIFGSIFGED